MLGDTSSVSTVYLVTGYTDMRKSIDGLAAIVQGSLQLDPYSRSIFIFCGRRRDRLKALLWEGDGFVLMYKRLDNGSFKCRSETQARQLVTAPPRVTKMPPADIVPDGGTIRYSNEIFIRGTGVP